MKKTILVAMMATLAVFALYGRAEAQIQEQTIATIQQQIDSLETLKTKLVEEATSIKKATDKISDAEAEASYECYNKKRKEECDNSTVLLVVLTLMFLVFMVLAVKVDDDIPAILGWVIGLILLLVVCANNFPQGDLPPQGPYESNTEFVERLERTWADRNPEIPEGLVIDDKKAE